jgi:hypothetical protein
VLHESDEQDRQTGPTFIILERAERIIDRGRVISWTSVAPRLPSGDFTSRECLLRSKADARRCQQWWKADIQLEANAAERRTLGTLSPNLRFGAAEDNVMAWQEVRDSSPPIDRPVLIRTTDSDEPVIAFLTADNVWYSGGALVQNSDTVLGAVPHSVVRT